MTPFLSRVRQEDVLRGRREILYEAIRANPGICFTELSRVGSMDYGVLGYHLQVLETTGYVRSAKAGRYRRYFEYNGHPGDQYEPRAYACNPDVQDFLAVLQQNPDTTQNELAQRVGVTRQAVAYRLDRLEKLGLVERERIGRRHHYRVLSEAYRDAAPYVAAPSEQPNEVLRVEE